MDLATKTSYKLREFFDGTETIATLLNCVQWFDRERTSYLGWARANDVELYRESQRRRAESGEKKPAKRRPTIETFEYSPVVELLSSIFEIGQQNVFYTATHGSKAAKRKPKITRYPRPTTAAAKVKRAAAREQMKRMDEVLVFSDEPYGADSSYVRHSKLPASAGTGTPQRPDGEQRDRRQRGMWKPGQEPDT